MTNPNESRVISLFAWWEQRQEVGEVISPDELCEESLELLEQFKAQLELQQGFTTAASQTKVIILLMVGNSKNLCCKPGT